MQEELLTLCWKSFIARTKTCLTQQMSIIVWLYHPWMISSTAVWLSFPREMWWMRKWSTEHFELCYIFRCPTKKRRTMVRNISGSIELRQQLITLFCYNWCTYFPQYNEWIHWIQWIKYVGFCILCTLFICLQSQVYLLL